MRHVKYAITVILCSLNCQAMLALDFSSAYSDILINTYELKAADAEIIAKEADRWQAGAYPNPALAVTLSSIGRKQDGNENELFVGVTQLFELGGKRAARLRVSARQIHLVQLRGQHG